MSLHALQFTVLPFGSVLALLAICWAAWRLRNVQARRAVVSVLLVGVAGSSLLVAAFHFIPRLPWQSACLGCPSSQWWFSYVLTFVQGFGLFSALALFARWLYGRRGVRAA